MFQWGQTDAMADKTFFKKGVHQMSSNFGGYGTNGRVEIAILRDIKAFTALTIAHCSAKLGLIWHAVDLIQNSSLKTKFRLVKVIKLFF